jgi:uncharacterized protein (TIGR02246 family)
MTLRPLRSFSALLVLASLGCSAEAPSADPTMRPAQPAPIAQADVDAGIQQTVAALSARDAAKAAAAYTPDAVFVNARGKFETQQAIQSFWAEALKAPDAGKDLKLDVVKWGASGDMAYSLSRFTGGITAGSGHVLAVHVRQPDGSMQTVAQVSIPDPAAR